MSARVGLASVLTLAAVAVGAAASAPAGATPASPSQIVWLAPSPADGTAFNVQTGSPLSVSVAAGDTTQGAVVHVSATGLPDGATLTPQDGNPGTATLTWTPTAAQVGSYTVIFTAADQSATPVAGPTLSISIVVAPPLPPPTIQLSDDKVARWALVLKPVVARTGPSSSARAVTTLSTVTGDYTQNLVLALEQHTDANGVWVHVRLAILPNNSTGWVPRAALGTYNVVHTHLYVDRGLQTAVLLQNGKPVFRARVGVGKPYWPTPRGEFYIRDKLIGFADPFYGPIAFGTSARSAVLTDWPGGGYVGVHGTSLPQLIPGRISHGCIRVRNKDILRLAALMPVGTPLTIT